MQIHELNNFTGTLGSGAYLAIDDGTDTGKISSQGLLAATEARIDNIIAGPAPSAEEIVDARLGADGVTYPSLGDAIRDQFSDVKSDIEDLYDFSLTVGNRPLLSSTSKFVSGLWTGNGYRTDGNYGKYKSLYTDNLIALQDITVEVSSADLTSYVCSIAIFDSNKDFLSAPASMGNVDISSGSLNVLASSILALYGGAAYISVEIGKVSGSTFYNLNADTAINVYGSAAIDIPQEISDIKDEITTLKGKVGEPILETDSFFYGMWTSSGLRTDNAYGLLKTHQNFLSGGNYKIVVEDGISGVDNYVVSVTTYDANKDFVEIKPSNTYMHNGVYYYKGTDTAKFIRINIGILVGGSYTQVPNTASIKVIAIKDYSLESTITVDKNGKGDFDLIADAIRFANDSLTMPVTIFIKNGVYDEVCNVKRRYLSFIGENREAVIWVNHTGMYANAPLFIDGNFTVENITFEMLDDEAPDTWTPGTSQNDPATMLPGYAFHIDGGAAYTPQNSIYSYRLGVVRNCTFYSVAFPAVGTGLHSYEKLVFENCEFIRETSAKYHTNYSAYQGAFLNHATTHSDDYNDEHLEMINCRCICNLGAAATLDYSGTYSDDTDLNFIGNTFWAEETSDATIVFNQSTATLLGTSRLNNATALNA